MACEYHLGSRSSYLVKHAYGPSTTTVSSSPLCVPRIGSYRKPKPEQPMIKNKCSTNCHNKSDNNNLSSNYLSSSSAVRKAVAHNTLSHQSEAKNTTTPTSSMLGANKSYYSSTRSFSSKCAANGVTVAGGCGGCNAAPAPIGTGGSAFVRNSKTTSSSGNSSVESIVPKYTGLNGNSLADGGAKKRAYQPVRGVKKTVPLAHQPDVVPGITRVYGAGTTAATTKSSHHLTSSKNANKKQMTVYGHNNNNISSSKSSSSSGYGSNSNSNNRIYSSFSKKFPNGLPFEDEFYRSRKRDSVKSENSDFSTAYESDQCPLPFEEEFSRRKSFTEPLYVDFSKPVPSKEGNNDNDDDHDDDHHQTVVKNDFFDKFDRASNFVCNPNEVIVQDQPVVHVAVTWWAPERQQFGTDLVSQSAGVYDKIA